jgi:hypothetical protein
VLLVKFLMDDRIGEIAGKVWDFLSDSGESSLTSINDAVDAPRSQVCMALGWLAREGNLNFNEEGRGTSFSLK